MISKILDSIAKALKIKEMRGKFKGVYIGYTFKWRKINEFLRKNKSN